MNVLFIFGTRPEAIKLAPLVHAMRVDGRFTPVVCVTGQHREMLDQALDLFDLTPDIDLNAMTRGQGSLELCSKLINGVGKTILEVQPSLVVVQGDTNSTFAGALAAFHSQIPIAHVEAGLRTHNLMAPWPEEGNRQMTSRLADFHFAPTTANKDNLCRESIPEDRIWVTGNTVIDALRWIGQKNKQRENWSSEFGSLGDPRKTEGRIILVTGHRRENFGGGLERVCDAILEIATQRSNCKVVYPVHLNPSVSGPVQKKLGNQENVYLLGPLAYDKFVYLLESAFLVLTDSGGIQEEAPSLGKPVLVTRDVTERQEAVIAGTVKLVGTRTSEIVESVMRLLEDPDEYDQMALAHNPYGNGSTCKQIIEALATCFNV